MSTRPLIALVVGALLLRPLAVVAAQDTSDTVQGYAPAEAPRPSAAATAARARSSRRSAGSITSRCSSSALDCDISDTGTWKA